MCADVLLLGYDYCIIIFTVELDVICKLMNTLFQKPRSVTPHHVLLHLVPVYLFMFLPFLDTSVRTHHYINLGLDTSAQHNQLY